MKSQLAGITASCLTCLANMFPSMQRAGVCWPFFIAPCFVAVEIVVSVAFHAGALAEWLCSGLQIRGHRFDSGTRLHLDGHVT